MTGPRSGGILAEKPSKRSAQDGQPHWGSEAKRLAGLPNGGINITHEAVDRHVDQGNGDRLALRWLGRQGERREFTFAQLSEFAARAAQVLKAKGVGKGDVVALLLPKLPEFYAAALGIWKLGAVCCPLFPGFGPGPIRARLEISKAKVLVASDSLFTRKVAGQRAQLTQLNSVLVVGEGSGAATKIDGCEDFRALLADARSDGITTLETSGEDPALLHFTSGTTGTPKGAIHAHKAVLSHLVSANQVFGLGPKDTYWCTCDPGWMPWTAYGVIAPLANGCLTIAEEGEIDPRRWYAILRDEKVTVWYTTPTAIRKMMRYGAALARSYRQNSLRIAASVGEPLNGEAVSWGMRAFGIPFLDTWWQTETGAIAMANLGNAAPPGSMGRPLPGVDIAVVRRELTKIEVVNQADEVGELAVREGVPSMFTGYVGDPDRYAQGFFDGWYLSGDLVKRDRDGNFWFVGRVDDMIKSGGYSIGPFEVERALLDHPAVAEVAVVGKPDLLLREVPIAFMSLNPGFDPGDALRTEVLGFAHSQLGSAMAPQEVHFLDTLPKTSSGKILRRVLKMKAMGDPEDAELYPPQP